MKLAKISSIAAIAVAMVLGGAAVAAEKFKVGFVYVSPIGDAGWTFQHELGRKALEAALGDKIETTFVESVPEGADAERVIRELAASGNKIIFTTSFGYMNPTLKVAKQFPKVMFEHATGYKRSKNVATYSARFYEGRYLTGIAAGKATKSNILGYVAAFPIPEVVRGINAFARGARSVNPKAEVRVIWISTWFDPGKERESAETLISQGADVVTHGTDSTAIVQTAEDRGVNAVGYHSDMAKFGPKAHLTASTHKWGGYYIDRVKAAMSGSWKSGDTWNGISDGVVDITPFGAGVSEETRALINVVKKKIASAAMTPFDGPIKDNEGKMRVEAGASMSDKDLGGMNWYVEGIVGKLPK
ncbi:MAG: BMP family ABC transporter substrate-binding protein [Alphaproteobacteria bacterium]